MKHYKTRQQRKAAIQFKANLVSLLLSSIVVCLFSLSSFLLVY